MMFDLAQFIDEKYAWSRRTFGEGRRTGGILAHMIKEMEEINQRPTELEEWVDIILLAFDGASRAGHSGSEIADAILTKQMINLVREWPTEQVADHLPVEHVRKELIDDPNSSSGKSLRVKVVRPKIVSPYDAGDL